MAGTGGEKTRRIRNILVLVGALVAAGFALSLQQSFTQVREDRYLLAVSTGKVIFRTIVATRTWNASHGGVYVPVTETIRPNPYLTGPDRDVRTTDGRELTKVNPAYMTRLTTHAVSLATALAILFFLGLRIMKLAGSLKETQRQVRTLEGILPMCANCKKIRKEGAAPTDPKSWMPVDSYITDHSEAKFSHGICPECAKALYGWSEKETPPGA
jgi:hypothetical protein